MNEQVEERVASAQGNNATNTTQRSKLQVKAKRQQDIRLNIIVMGDEH